MLDFHNDYLASLPVSIRKGWQSRARLVELHKGEHIDLSIQTDVIYFPITAVAAMSARSGTGPPVFLRFTGRHFAIGVANLLKAGEIRFEGWVCGTGYAMAIPAGLILNDLKSITASSPLQARLMARIAEKGLFCNHCATNHLCAKRLARLLLEARDAFGPERGITLSQRELSDLLAVRRETVAELLGAWSAEGVIECGRASISILDIDGLGAKSCECYRLIKRFDDEELSIWRGIPWRGDAPERARLTSSM